MGLKDPDVEFYHGKDPSARESAQASDRLWEHEVSPGVNSSTDPAYLTVECFQMASCFAPHTGNLVKHLIPQGLTDMFLFRGPQCHYFAICIPIIKFS
jgi:hypothetical protein